MSWTVRSLTLVVTLAIAVSTVTSKPNRPRPWADDVMSAKMIESSIGLKLMRIEPGVFLMGAPEGEPDRQGRELPHEVAITRPFYIGKFEVTQDEYQKIMGTNPAAFSPNGRNKASVNGLDTRRFPIEMVSWNEAKEFCRKLTLKDRQELRIPPSAEYALPTEAEWEYCCRAGTKTAFHYGPTMTTAQGNIAGNGGAANLNRTTAVGSYSANAWGLHDMHGNVWEWCEDAWDDNFYRNSPRNDPLFMDKGTQRVLRGGGWGVGSSLCRSALRGVNGIDTRYDYNGFRIVLRLNVKTN